MNSLTSNDKLRSLATSENALEMGKAAEHIVCADLILSGYRAYLSDQGLPYDVVLDLGARLLRVQVKSTSFVRNVNASGRSPTFAYNFHARRRGRKSTGRLGNEDCDLIALVALDIKVVAYFPIVEVGQTCQLLPPGHETKGKMVRKRWNIDQFPIGAAIERMDSDLGDIALVPYRDGEVIECDGKQQSLREWSKEVGLTVCVIESRLRNGWPVYDALYTAADLRNRNPEKMIEFRGEIKTLNTWAKELGMSRACLWQRQKSGWDIERMLTTPSRAEVKRMNKEAQIGLAI